MALLGILIKSDHNEEEMDESRKREGCWVDEGDLTISRGKGSVGRECAPPCWVSSLCHTTAYTLWEFPRNDGTVTFWNWHEIVNIKKF